LQNFRAKRVLLTGVLIAVNLPAASDGLEESWRHEILKGHAMMQSGRPLDAERAYAQALSIAGKSPSTDLRFILALYDLALAYQGEGRHTESEQLLEKARRLSAGTLKQDDSASLAITESIGVQLFYLGRYSEAETLFRDVLSRRERAQGHEQCDTAKTMNNLGGLYAITGGAAKADRLLREAVSIEEKHCPANDLETAKPYNNLASLEENSGKYEQADEDYRKALEIVGRSVGERHPEFALVLANRARCNLRLRRYEAAEEMCSQSIATIRNSLGDRSPQLVLPLTIESAALKKLNRKAEAKQLLGQAERLAKDDPTARSRQMTIDVRSLTSLSPAR